MTSEEYFKIGNIVDVEPGKGFARIVRYRELLSDEPYDAENITVIFDILGGDGHQESVYQDNVFMVHEEFYYNSLESATGRLMDSAGNYQIPGDVEKILQSIRLTVEAYRLAINSGQVKRRG